jgi:hypothetical protein
MLLRGKEAGDARRPGNPWFAGAAIGIAISSMAAGAMMLGASLAVVQATPTSRLPAR